MCRIIWYCSTGLECSDRFSKNYFFHLCFILSNFYWPTFNPTDSFPARLSLLISFSVTFFLLSVFHVQHFYLIIFCYFHLSAEVHHLILYVIFCFTRTYKILVQLILNPLSNGSSWRTWLGFTPFPQKLLFPPPGLHHQ